MAIWLQHKQGTLAFPAQTVPRTAPAGHCQHTQKHRAAQGWHACGQLCMASSSVMFHLPFECTAIPFVTGLASLCPFSSTVPCPAGDTGLLDSTTPCSQQFLEGPWLLPGCTTKLVETHQQSGIYFLNTFPMWSQTCSSYGYFNPTIATYGNVFLYLLGQTCHLCHSTFNEDVVGPRTSAALMLVNLTAYTSEQTFVQRVPLSGAGLLVHLPGLPSGWTLLVPQALHVQDTTLHLGASNAPGLGHFPQVRASGSCPGLVLPTAPARAVVLEDSLDCPCSSRSQHSWLCRCAHPWDPGTQQPRVSWAACAAPDRP